MSDSKTSNLNSNDFDQVFLDILQDFCAEISNSAKNSTEHILKLSHNFLNKETHEALLSFQDLYFDKDILKKSESEAINKEVDLLFEKIQSMSEDEIKAELESSSFKEDPEHLAKRLRLSGIQKKLEMIISLDVGIKDKLIPILYSMQFEDMLNHRLKNISAAWATLLKIYTKNKSKDLLFEQLKKLPTSNKEREIMYRVVLKSTPPDTEDTKIDLLTILF